MENSAKNKSSPRLTQTVHKGGCAAKVAAVELRKILAQVQFPPAPPELMIGTGTFDDAAIYRVNADLALVQTLDFFTPIVDTPFLFGQIAAANALSDVYAMGGRPVTAMGIFAFPLAVLDTQVAVDVLQGASAAIGQAGAALVGGHTIDDDTLKFGLSVTGFVHPDRVWSNAGARPGDVLILTKAVGTGTLTAALKRGALTEADLVDALTSMCQLNDVPARLTPELLGHVHAATDITGFGLGGHSLNLARSSGVSLTIDYGAIPRFERAAEFLEKGFLTKAHRSNFEYVRDETHFDREDEIARQLIFDPQTSGGLLLAVSLEAADAVVEVLAQTFPRVCKIGVVEHRTTSALRFF